MNQGHLDPLILVTLKKEVISLHNLIKTQLNPFTLVTRLYDAALKGDLISLHNLLQEDPLILDRCIYEKSDHFMQSPLHVSASLGHLEFTTELLRLKPELAKMLDESTRSSALHLASEKGHLDIVKKLIEVNPKMCFARDEDGRNTIHVAAISNQTHVLDLLVRMNPHAAQEKTNAGETLLHLCVKYSQLDSLKYLVNAMREFINVEDNDGNTVLHLAVLAKQLQVVEFLLSNRNMKQNAINKNGLTAIDCFIQAKKDENDEEIVRILIQAKAITAKNVEKQRNVDGKWLDKQRSTLMVVASLIASMVFQVSINPPVGSGNNLNPDQLHRLEALIVSNTISLVSSLSVVLLLISGLSCKRLFVILLMITMWVSITSALWSYFHSFRISLDGKFDFRNLRAGVKFTVFVWVLLLVVTLLGNVIRLIIKPKKKKKKLVQLMKWPHNTSSLRQFLDRSL